MPGALPDPAAAEAALLDAVAALARELRPGRAPGPVTLDSQLDRDLGFDSLGRVELVARLEQLFAVTLPDGLAVEAETPRDLVRAVRAAPSTSPARTPPPRAAAPRPPATAGVPHVPADARSWVEVLARHAADRPDAVCIRFWSDADDGTALDHAALRDGARRLAAGLLERGLAPGEAVALMLPTSPDYFLTFAGIWLAGGVPVPVYPPFRPAQIEEHVRRQTGILANCRAALLVTTPEFAAVARLVEGSVATLRGVVTPAELAASGTPPEPALGGAETALLQYTSGSTAAPKGVILSHANLLANVRAMGTAVEVRPDDVTVSWLPLYHDMGLIGAWLGSLYHGVPLVVMPPLAFIGRPVRWLRAIHRWRGTLTAAPNFAFELCTRRIRDEELEGLDLSSLRGVYNGAEPVSPDTLERFTRRFAPLGFQPEAMMPVYGLAEACVGLTFPPLGRGPLVDRIDRRRLALERRAEPVGAEAADARLVVACGRPLPRHEVRIVDDADRELPDRQEGHIQFRGPSATSGYLHNPAATARLFHGDWLDTGDLGYVAAGELYVTGRVKDLIIKAGRNIYPEELEEAVGALDGIRRGNVAAFGVPGPGGDEDLVVVAETRKSDPAGRAALEQAIEGLAVDLTGMPADRVILAPPNTVPKTSSGKIRRGACRDLLLAGAIGGRRKPVWRQVAALWLGSLGTRLVRLRSAAGAWAFAIYAWAVVGLAGALGAAAAFLLPGVARRWRAARAVLRGAAWATRTRLEVTGQDHIPAGPAVLVANHTSYLDVFVLIAALERPAAFVAKAEFLGQPVLAALLRRFGVVFVERLDKAKGIADARALGEAAARSGLPLLFFPEGTFTRMPGLLPFHMGGFLLAAETGMPVVPIGIRGTRSILRSDSWFPRPGDLAVVIGAPIAPEAAPGTNHWPAAVRLRDAAHAHIQRVTGEPDLPYAEVSLGG